VEPGAVEQRKQPRKKPLKRKQQRKNKMQKGKADVEVRLFSSSPISSKNTSLSTAQRGVKSFPCDYCTVNIELTFAAGCDR
jgi:hypothetical protein